MKKKKRIKVKKKGFILVLIIFLFGISGLLFFIKYQENQSIKLAKKNFHPSVITTKKINLYDKNKKVIGMISKNYSLEIEKSKTKYYKIKNTNYYISYKDIKESKNKKETNNYNYLVFNENIKSNKKITLSKNNKKVITLKNGINSPIYYQDKSNYYISFLNDIFSVPKKTVKKVKKENTKEKEATSVSILYYDTIDSSCSGYSCTSLTTINEHINKLKENGYYTISLDEYQKFIEQDIHLKDKALLLVTKEKTDIIKTLEDNHKIKIETNNDQLNNKKYEVKSYTTTDNIIKMANGEEVIENPPVINDQKIAVLNYHFFFDSSIGESCPETICLEASKLREHLQYLKDNNYKTLTMEEFKRWMYGEIELPEKSVLLTIDDGAKGTGAHNGNKLIPLLEEYQMNATLFLIAGWWDIENYRSPYLTIQSHTYDMHQYGPCGKGQLNCATLEEAKTDLRKSLDIIKNSDSFCFPFYYYSDTSIQAVKDVGFKLAFIGGNRKATRKNNKYLIPRYPILSDITMQQFIDKIS